MSGYYLLILLVPLFPFIAFYLFLFVINFIFTTEGARKLASGRYEVIAAPLEIPRWTARLESLEAELFPLGFTRMHYFHNAQYASEGQPNFTAVYFSSDRLMCISAYFSLWPRNGIDFADMDPAEDQEIIALTCSSVYSGPRWVISSQDADEKGSTLPAPFFQYYYPRSMGPTDIVNWHRRLITAAPQWSSQAPVPFTTTEEYMQLERTQHRALVNDFYWQRWKIPSYSGKGCAAAAGKDSDCPKV